MGVAIVVFRFGGLVDGKIKEDKSIPVGTQKTWN
jgi:hypothetical protein